MEMNVDQIFENAVRDGMREGVKARLSQYNAPIWALIDDTIKANSGGFRKLLEEAISGVVNDDLFRKEIISATRTALAKTLVQRFGGEIEKQINALKSDPATRARITLAIEAIASGPTSS